MTVRFILQERNPDIYAMVDDWLVRNNLQLNKSLGYDNMEPVFEMFIPDQFMDDFNLHFRLYLQHTPDYRKDPPCM